MAEPGKGRDRGAPPLTRRDFLMVAGTAAGGLMVGLPAAVDAGSPAAAGGRFGIYVEVTPDNRVRLAVPQSEMGQGVHDSLAKILAEELEADWRTVEILLPWADDAFVNPISKRQRTANSESVTIYYDLLRRAGAGAREMLVAAAAQRWNVAAAECAAAGSRVTHAGSRRTATYGELAALAATLPPPAEPRLKSPSDFRLIGRTIPRRDTPPKTDGSLQFGIDVRRPAMVYAALRRAPEVDAKLVRFDRDAALKLPGVIDAFAVTDGVAVVADSTWRAFKAAESLDAQFDASASREVAQEPMRRRMHAALDDDAAALPGRPAFGGPPYDKAATLAAIDGAAKKLEFVYEVPFLAHAALEPLTCTAIVNPDSCEIWVPTQQPDRSLDAAVEITKLPKDKIRLNTTFIGGGFGRKWELDFLRQCVEIATKVPGRPVKLTWTREQDFRHDRYRPAHVVRTRAGLSADGRLVGLHSRITGINMWKQQKRPAIPGMGDVFALGLLINDLYAIPQRYADNVETNFPVPVGTWRSVSASMNVFFGESAIDDIAAASGRDPYEFRRELLAKSPRGLAVLDAAARAAGWGTPLPKGRGRGIAFNIGFGSYCAQVVEVTLTGKAVRVDRIVCAFDCGTVVDPRGLSAQLEGGIVFGLSAARNGRITFADGAAQETNFHQGPLLTMSECPRTEIVLVPSGEKPGGAGEASVPPVAPALAGAIVAAGGERPRRLPIIDSGYELA